MKMAAAIRRFKWSLFARDLRIKRNILDMGLREMARMLEVNHATLCRAEHGKPIEVPDFTYLCNFIDQHPRRYLYPSKPQRLSADLPLK